MVLFPLEKKLPFAALVVREQNTNKASYQKKNVGSAARTRRNGAGARASWLQRVLQLRVEAGPGPGAGFRAEGHVNLNLHRPPHPVRPAGP